MVIDSAKKERSLEHINNLDPHIQVTTEDAKADGSIPFLDSIVMPQSDNSLLTLVYTYTCVLELGQSSPPVSKVQCY